MILLVRVYYRKKLLSIFLKFRLSDAGHSQHFSSVFWHLAAHIDQCLITENNIRRYALFSAGRIF